jgi:oligoendopeptidase F
VSQRLRRSDVPQELTWRLEDLFPTEQAWEQALASLSSRVSEVTVHKGRLGESAKTLQACLDAREALQKEADRVLIYAQLQLAADGSNPVHQGNVSRAMGVMAEVEAQLSFVESEILDLPDGVLERFIEEEPGLATWRKYLSELLERKPHRLHPEAEEVIAALGEILEAPYTIYERAKSSDMQCHPIQVDGKELPVSLALYEDQYELSPDTNVRRAAFASFTNTLKQYQNTVAAGYATEVKKQVTMARLRNYESVTHMLLQPQQVTFEMYHNLLDVIQTELAPHMRRLAKLKQRVLGLETMRHCDLKVPLDAEYSPSISYAEASRLILDALSVLGPEYVGIMEQALTDRWVDLADNIGKSTGAFCTGHYDVHPYILITWTDTMRGAFVLAHELGHAGHFALASRNQRPSSVWPSMYFSEAPSTMNELLLAQHLLAQAKDERMRRWVILQSLGTYYHNFVTHLLEGELQRRIYRLAEEGVPITAQLLNEQKGEVLSNFWGDAVEIDEGARLTWMRQPHYYMGLYPYTYSAGLTISTAVAQKIQEEGQPAVDRWLEALRAGDTLRPLELAKLAGVDMSTPEPIRTAVAYVGKLVDELEESF